MVKDDDEGLMQKMVTAILWMMRIINSTQTVLQLLLSHDALNLLNVSKMSDDNDDDDDDDDSFLFTIH